MKREMVLGNILAGVTIFIWGITFVSTKVLLKDFSPEDILVYRFVIAFAVLFVIVKGKIVFGNLREELLFAFLGLTGIALYFWVENLALKYTYAANVGLISSSIPLFTVLTAYFTGKKKEFSVDFLLGFCIAIIGIIMVIYNGRVMNLNPMGDFLALITAVLFALYSVFLNKIDKKSGQIDVTAKIFFYGMIFITIIGFVNGTEIPGVEKLNLRVIINFLFLALFASVLCFIMWNKAVSLIGPVMTANYIYLVPLIAMVSAAIIINEKISQVMAFGGVLIVFGVYLNNSRILTKGIARLKEQRGDL